MKKISLILLLITAAFNTSAPMAKNAKNNPALPVTASSKLQANNQALNQAAIMKLTAQPIVFINPNAISSETEGSLEWHQLAKELTKLAELQNQGQGYDFERSNQIYEQQAKIQNKLLIIGNAIAKRLGACALMPTDNKLYVDPAYDITKEAITELNKSYVPIQKASSKLLPQDALYEGILKNSEEEALEAISNGANVNYIRSGKSELYWAITLKKSKAAKALIDNNATIDMNYIQLALENNDIKSAGSIAIKSASNLNTIYTVKSQKGTLAEFAATRMEYSSILALIKKGASVSPELAGVAGRPLIVAAASHTHSMTDSMELIQEFVNQGYNLNKVWESDSVVYQNVAYIKFLLQNGAHPNHVFSYTDYYGKLTTWTPLLRAIHYGSLDTVKLLLKAGANVNQKATPFSAANASQPQGPLTPLAYAMNLGAVNIIPVLLENGAFAS